MELGETCLKVQAKTARAELAMFGTFRFESRLTMLQRHAAYHSDQQRTYRAKEASKSNLHPSRIGLGHGPSAARGPVAHAICARAERSH